MEYSVIGDGLKISKICLGTMTFGSPVGEADAIELVHFAKDAGINFVDTANMYEGYNRYAGSAGGVAEEILGKAVKGSRSEYILATKLGMKVGEEPWDENTSGKAIEIQLDRSLKRMDTDYVDIYYLHKYDPDTEPGEIAIALSKALKSGKIRSFAVSNYDDIQLEGLIKAVREENIPMPVLCQPALSMVNTANLEKLIPLCVKEGIGVIPYQVLQGGILTGKYKRGEAAPEGSRGAEKPEWMKPMTDEVFDIIEKAEADAKACGRTMTQYALNWALNQPGVVSTLVGVKRKEQITEALGAL